MEDLGEGRGVTLTVIGVSGGRPFVKLTVVDVGDSVDVVRDKY